MATTDFVDLSPHPSAPPGPLPRLRHRAARNRGRSAEAGHSTAHGVGGSGAPGLRLAGWVVAGLWCAGLLVLSAALYRRFALSQDFGIYAQAWTGIGTGHLDPAQTIYGTPFLRANFELVMWPLALLHLVVPSPFTLLAVQDLSVAGSGLVAYLWVVDVVGEKAFPRWAAYVLPSVAGLAILADPGMYSTVGFDFHVEPLATLLLLLAGRDLWRGRTRRAAVFAAAVLLCGAFAALGLLGLGLSALLAGRATRRTGGVLVAAGAAWWVLVLVLHVNHAALSQYAYLAGRSPAVAAGGVAIAVGAVTHPLRVLHQLQSRLADIWVLVRPAGLVGLASAWGFGVPAVVMAADALNSQRLFITESFQNFAVFPFLLVGTVMVVAWSAPRWRRVALVLGGGFAVLVAAATLTVTATESASTVHWVLDQRVAPGEAGALQLALSRTPADAEVIATRPVLGRFCTRPSCHVFLPYVTQHVDAPTVVFVLADDGRAGVSPSDNQASAAYVRQVLHGTVLVDRAGVVALAWHPRAVIKLVTVPRYRPGTAGASG